MINADFKLLAKHESFPYQREAVDAVKDLDYAAIFHEQGLGKTKIAIDLALYWLKSGGIDAALVVTKKGLVNNWKKEIRAHTHILPIILSEKDSRSYSAIKSKTPIYLTHFELLKADPDLIRMLLKKKAIGIILDEAQKIKNPESALTKSILGLSGGFKKKLILTGTPVANRPYDIWSQVYFLDDGESLGSDFKTFKREYDLPSINQASGKNSEALDNSSLQIKNFEERLSTLFDKIDDFSVRETKENAGILLPHKVYSEIECVWSKEQKNLYRDIKDEIAITVTKDGEEVQDFSDALLKKLLRLVQVASNPLVIDEKYEEIPGKFIKLVELLDSIISRGEKAIIWSNFTANVDWLTFKLSEYGAVKIHGKMNMAQRNKSVDNFLNKETAKLLVATPAAAKEGLTLTVANHVIFYDRSFSLDDYLQAQDRIHRISQVKTCYIYNLILPESIDEWVESLISVKSAAAALAQGDILLEEYRAKANYDFKEVLSRILGDG